MSARVFSMGAVKQLENIGLTLVGRSGGWVVLCSITGKITMDSGKIYSHDGECCWRHRLWTDLPPKYMLSWVAWLIFKGSRILPF